MYLSVRLIRRSKRSFDSLSSWVMPRFYSTLPVRTKQRGPIPSRWTIPPPYAIILPPMEKKRSISLVDLQGQYRAIRKEIDQAFQAVLERGQFILGPEVETLEKEVAASCRTQRAVGTASGTGALELSLRAFGIGEGDEVIVPAFTFLATALSAREGYTIDTTRRISFCQNG